MKICTYNIWDEDTNFNKRLELLVKEINKYDIDILALQEVRDEKTLNYIKDKTDFKVGYYFEGLAFLSNFDIKLLSTYSSDNNYILRVSNGDIAYTNVHFDWQKESNRLKGLDYYFGLLEEDILDNEIILGDFNSEPESKLHFELLMSDFIDLHQHYCHSVNEVPLPTLDLINNPRWRHQKIDEEPLRFDWIMLNTENEYTLNGVKLVGTEEENEIAPSDHYSVLIDIKL